MVPTAHNDQFRTQLGPANVVRPSLALLSCSGLRGVGRLSLVEEVPNRIGGIRSPKAHRFRPAGPAQPELGAIQVQVDDASPVASRPNLYFAACSAMCSRKSLNMPALAARAVSATTAPSAPAMHSASSRADTSPCHSRRAWAAGSRASRAATALSAPTRPRAFSNSPTPLGRWSSRAWAAGSRASRVATALSARAASSALMLRATTYGLSRPMPSAARQPMSQPLPSPRLHEADPAVGQDCTGRRG